MNCVIFTLLFVLISNSVAEPEYTTPGGILSTNCHKGCTEVVVHESNCNPVCNIQRYERCVLDPRTPEPTCGSQNVSSAIPSELKRPYVCRCHPCLFRDKNEICVPQCPETEGEA
ncbi:hypothetical protein X975_18281, partial [Stegodyphus mimosarum]